MKNDNVALVYAASLVTVVVEIIINGVQAHTTLAMTIFQGHGSIKHF